MNRSRIAALAPLCLPWTLLAQAPPPPADSASPARVARSARVSTAPVIDGRLDETVWRDGTPLTQFLQRDPAEGEPSSERTEVRLLSDGEALYIGAWLFDRNADGIVPGERLRDVTLSNSDYFAVIFDTYHDRQNGFVFATTPSGVEHDGQVVREGEGGGVFQQGQTRAQAGSAGGFNLNWDASWKVATTVDRLGWYAEMRIPFSTLRYGSAREQTWGLNFARSIRRRNEESFWAPIPRQFNLYRLSRAGVLEGLQVPSQRIATATPYVLSSAVRSYSAVGVTPPSAASTYPTEFGIDAKLGLTPSLTLDATYNTDFAQVEVDEQRTNLTRFPLFFPEKRPFFLENAGIFSAGTPQAVDLFFSRRIGIDTLGRPVPIVGGGRITGKVQGLTVGLMQLFTEQAAGGIQPANSFTVGRVTREFGGRSRIGVIGVQRIATKDGDDRNRTFGIDGRFALSDPLSIDWWAAKTATPGRSGRDGAFSVRFGHQTRVWNNAFRFVQVGEDFNPEVGFVGRVGYRYYEGALFRTVPVKGFGLRYWMPHVNYRGYFGFDDKVQSEQIHIDFGEVEFANGGRLGPELNLFREGLTRPFRIDPTVTLAAREYQWASLNWDFSTNPSAPVSFITRLEAAGFYNGSRYGGTATLTVRKGSSLTTSLVLDYNDVSLKDTLDVRRSFVRSLVGVRLGYFFTPRIFLQSLVQYNNQAQVFSANVRFAWLNTAGTGLFVVLNDAETATGVFDWQRPTSRSFVVKFTKQFGTGG
jgi:hypothetical protein